MSGEYISREAAENAFCKYMGFTSGRVALASELIFAKIPAADVVAVRHEQWIDKNQSNRSRFQYWICSGCGYARSSNWAWEKSEKPQVKYCENCGAKMDGGQDE